MFVSFTNKVGPTVPLAGGDVFSQFFTSSLVSRVVEETNRYANVCRRANITDDDSEDTEWMTDEDENKAFIGFTILMGVNRLPGLSILHSTTSQLPLAFPDNDF